MVSTRNRFRCLRWSGIRPFVPERSERQGKCRRRIGARSRFCCQGWLKVSTIEQTSRPSRNDRHFFIQACRKRNRCSIHQARIPTLAPWGTNVSGRGCYDVLFGEDTDTTQIPEGSLMQTSTLKTFCWKTCARTYANLGKGRRCIIGF